MQHQRKSIQFSSCRQFTKQIRPQRQSININVAQASQVRNQTITISRKSGELLTLRENEQRLAQMADQSGSDSRFQKSPPQTAHCINNSRAISQKNKTRMSINVKSQSPKQFTSGANPTDRSSKGQKVTETYESNDRDQLLLMYGIGQSNKGQGEELKVNEMNYQSSPRSNSHPYFNNHKQSTSTTYLSRRRQTSNRKTMFRQSIPDVTSSQFCIVGSKTHTTLEPQRFIQQHQRQSKSISGCKNIGGGFHKLPGVSAHKQKASLGALDKRNNLALSGSKINNIKPVVSYEFLYQFHQQQLASSLLQDASPKKPLETENCYEEHTNALIKQSSLSQNAGTDPFEFDAVYQTKQSVLSSQNRSKLETKVDQPQPIIRIEMKPGSLVLKSDTRNEKFQGNDDTVSTVKAHDEKYQTVTMMLNSLDQPLTDIQKEKMKVCTQDEASQAEQDSLSLTAKKGRQSYQQDQFKDLTTMQEFIQKQHHGESAQWSGDVQIDEPSSLFKIKGERTIQNLLHFGAQAPRHLISFKTKSEEESFMRLANRVYSLQTQSKDDVIYTYQRVFKYLMETLSQSEFEVINFYNVNRLIENIMKTRSLPEKRDQNPITLKRFIMEALELPYVPSDKSKKVISPGQTINSHRAKKVWQSNEELDLGQTFKMDYKRLMLMPRTDNQLKQQLEHYINSQRKVQNAPESSLNQILNKQFYQRSEKIQRPVLQRLSQIKKDQREFSEPRSTEQLLKESNLRRNNLVLEEVIRKREHENWFQEINVLMHEMQGKH